MTHWYHGIIFHAHPKEKNIEKTTNKWQRAQFAKSRSKHMKILGNKNEKRSNVNATKFSNINHIMVIAFNENVRLLCLLQNSSREKYSRMKWICLFSHKWMWFHAVSFDDFNTIHNKFYSLWSVYTFDLWNEIKRRWKRKIKTPNHNFSDDNRNMTFFIKKEHISSLQTFWQWK